ncbi:MAG: hypothetical protein M5R40_19490 [Anaerolineae bacterium]|nr:hypothetical protein [Anaerolineae bacterium]
MHAQDRQQIWAGGLQFFGGVGIQEGFVFRRCGRPRAARFPPHQRARCRLLPCWRRFRRAVTLARGR